MRQTISIKKTGSVVRLPFDFCIQCGTTKDAMFYSFEQKDDNPIAHLAKLAGDVGVLAEMALNQSHKVEAPFCARCFKRFSVVSPNRQLFHLGSLIIILLTIIAPTVTSSVVSFETSLVLFAIGILAAIGLGVWSRYYAWKNSPDIRRITSKKLIIKVRGRGKIVCELSEGKVIDS